jgi:hypothetical protein
VELKLLSNEMGREGRRDSGRKRTGKIGDNRQGTEG